MKNYDYKRNNSKPPVQRKITQGKFIFGGHEITEIIGEELRKLRWKQFSIISQSASLNPVYINNQQIREAIRTHEVGVSKKEATPKHPHIRALVEAVPVPNLDRRISEPQLEREGPGSVDLPEECDFRPRCDYATEACLEEPSLST